EFPRFVDQSGILPNDGFRRAHFREHFVKGEAFDAVTSAEAVDVEFAVTAVVFQREEVLPLGPGGVELGGLVSGGRQEEKGVVFDGHIPKVGSDMALYVIEVAEKPAGE